jgi:hypothetical protein
MARVKTRAYVSPTLVLLAFDWPEGGKRADFLGFAIRRSPGFGGEEESWLPNRLTFEGAAEKGRDAPSNENPIQKFLWWDARVDDKDRGKTLTYRIAPVVGAASDPQLLAGSEATLEVAVPHVVDGKIGSYFNRAVVSSQAFVQRFGTRPSGKKLADALVWLSNGMEQAIPGFVQPSPALDGAIYHLSDEQWVLPAFRGFAGRGSLVYNETSKDDTNHDVVEDLERAGYWTCAKRSRASIMHNKFLVRLERDEPTAVLMGSANFTTAGLTSQANVIHTFESRELASAYQRRQLLLADNPTLSVTARDAGWSDPIKVGDAHVRVFFSPEPKGERVSLDTVVSAINHAKRSVVFCLFMPTDRDLRDAAFAAADRSRMMFGLVNKIPTREPAGGDNAAAQAQVELYHRSRGNRDVFSHALFAKGTEPQGFWWEVANLPGGGGKFPVWIHHKFVVIDAETDDPIVFTGSANMSNGALHNNDENLLEIRCSKKLAGMYLAEGLRLYEHYRARAQRDRWVERPQAYSLRTDASWARKYFQKGNPEAKARESLAG